MMKTTLQLGGLHCSHCVKSVEQALQKLPSVRAIHIDLATQLAEIDSDETSQTLIDAIEQIGFDAEVK